MSVQFLPRLLQLILVVAITWIIAGWLKRAVTRAATRAHIEITLAKFFGNISRWMILIIGGIMVLGIFGVETTSLAAGLAAIGFAIGLALQGTLSNIASGIMLLILRPFRVGDFIKVNDIMGSVEEVELFNTSIDTIDNRRIVVPNSTIFGAVIENFTRHATRRVDITIGTAYSADLDATRTALLDAARSVPDRDPAQEPIVLLMELGSSSINWSVRIWCPTPKFWDVRDAAVRACKQALDAAGISIPFPQMDIHIQKWPGPPPSTTQSTPP
jgi:small conductance mechanosensitive channel